MHKDTDPPGGMGISVIMPVFNQAAFIARAVQSLLLQKFQDWELIIINDGSSDDLVALMPSVLNDKRIRYLENDRNEGLGKCLNRGLELALYPLISYLPADDVYYSDHLRDLTDRLLNADGAVLAYSGMRYQYNRFTEAEAGDHPLQLVQVLHRKTPERWMERAHLVTDDLEVMFWNRLRKYGPFIPSGSVTCEWVDHPAQRHKIIQEPLGGINPYKLYYGVKTPLIFHSSKGNLIDEVRYYNRFKKRKPGKTNGPLKILLVGELAYNAERILALEELGHKLYGLWTTTPYWYNTIGPLPFGDIEDLPYSSWQQSVKQIKPDVIYALLNWQAVPIAYEVLRHNPGIPFVWHFKEGPFICMEKGTWKQLIDLYKYSDGQIYNSPEMRDWFRQFLTFDDETTLLLDGDLPKREWFTEDRSAKLSDSDGEIHTVVPGRPIGLHPESIAELAANRIHLHFYGDFTHGQWNEWIVKSRILAPSHLHTHPHCTQETWVKEFSKYDAGWLHFFQSRNQGELMRADWDDLNYPARMATLAMAGLPMLQRDNTGHLVAAQNLVSEHKLGLFFGDMAGLSCQLSDMDQLKVLSERVWRKRMMFCFDSHAERLIEYFRSVIRFRNRRYKPWIGLRP
jgi:glycosyltransferase involved in cell wall biosynthesis